MKLTIKPAVFLLSFAALYTSCKKDIQSTESSLQNKQQAQRTLRGHLKQTNTYSSEVVIKWINVQLRLMATTTGVANVAFSRPVAYGGVALYESVVAGMPAYQSVAPQLNGLTGLPQTGHGLAYHWPSVANAALAAISKQMFPAASAASKAAIDSLEAALAAQFSSESRADITNRSIELGKAVAGKVLAWAETDGYLHASDAYTAPTGPGLWVPPSIPVPLSSTPYWGNLRVMVSGSGDNAQPGAPIAYSEDPASAFYQMAKEVYDASQTLTPEQTAMALYWRDVPGVTTPGHYISILKQLLESESTPLDEAAIGYALMGIAVYDAAISSWQTKYHYNLVRPITYIRNVLAHPTWTSLLATPAHPEYTSAHAVLSAAAADALTAVFGEIPFTDHTFDYLGMAARSFETIRDFGEEAGNSRLYAGIHYQPSIDAGLIQGRTVAQNIISSLQFSKGSND